MQVFDSCAVTVRTSKNITQSKSVNIVVSYWTRQKSQDSFWLCLHCIVVSCAANVQKSVLTQYNRQNSKANHLFERLYYIQHWPLPALHRINTVSFITLQANCWLLWRSTY